MRYRAYQWAVLWPLLFFKVLHRKFHPTFVTNAGFVWQLIHMTGSSPTESLLTTSCKT